ncbi:MAG TPA: transglycosylase SLT domain-containing protein [Nocardioidaceae bacterium]|nr:transglycosylase SLT domain-containing protein [Nocardioidaceae bacterium]
MHHRLLGITLAAACLLTACDSEAARPAARPTPSVVAPPSQPAVTLGPRPIEPTRVREAARPAELAQRVTLAEAVVRDPASETAAVSAAAFELQQLYRQLGRLPRWDDRVLTVVPRRLRLTVRANIAARREFRALHTTLSDTLPSWRIISPPPARRLLAYYRAAQQRFGVPWEVLAAVNLVETGMGRIRGTSVAGAQGPMQFMPATWDAFGRGDINDPRDAIMAAARYLAHNGGGRGQIDNALFRYNNSSHYVRGVKHYASVMRQDPAAFRGFYYWQIVYLSARGDVWLPVGYAQRDSIPVKRYLRANPDHQLTTP